MTVKAADPPSKGAERGLHWLPLGAVALVVQIGLIYGLATVAGGDVTLRVLLPIAHLLLIPFLVRNLSFWGMRLVLVGLLLNLSVMLANGGLMPVEGTAVEAVGRHDVSQLEESSHIPGSKNVLLTEGGARLRILSDVIVLPVPKPFTRAVSAGDLLVVAGVAIAYLQILRSTSSWKLQT